MIGFEKFSNLSNIIYLYFPCTDKQLQYIINFKYQSFSPRFFTNIQLFTTEEDAYKFIKHYKWKNNLIAINLCRFIINPMLFDSIHTNNSTMINIILNEINILNKNIVGFIEVISKVSLNTMEITN